MDSTSETGLLQRLADDGVLELILNRPERRNPLGSAMVGELLDALGAADANPAVRVILVRGEGESFSAGAELGEFVDPGKAPAHEIQVAGSGWADLISRFRAMDTPIVVAAQDYAIAGAVGLVAAADVALAARNAKFATREVKIGLFPLMIYPAVRDAVGPHRARELALSGRMIDADEALRVGLVHRVLPEDNFAEQARAVAAEMAVLGRETMRLSKEYLRQVEEVGFGPAVALGRATRGAFLSSPDFAEGVAAFFERWHEPTYPARAQGYGPALRQLLERGRELSAVDYQRVLVRRADFRGRVQRVFDEVDLVAVPAMAFVPPSLSEMTVITEEIIDGLHRFTCPFTMSLGGSSHLSVGS